MKTELTKFTLTKSRQYQIRAKSSLTEGVSPMRVFKQNKFLKFTGMVLLLIFAMAAVSNAQTWPAPAVPPTPAQTPAYAPPATGFEMTGFIEYASVDQMCLPNPDPTPENPPKPDGCKTSGGYIQVNGISVRVPANTVVQFPANTLTWEEV